MYSPRLHIRFPRPDVQVDSPLIDCRLLDLSTAGIGFETDIGLRLGVPYPFRLRDGDQILGTQAVVRWCRFVRNETVEGELRPVFRAGASFVDWQSGVPVAEVAGIEHQIDQAIDGWIDKSRAGGETAGNGRTIIHHRRRRSHG